MVVTSIHPGISRDTIQDNTGWTVRYGDDVAETPAPTKQELEILRDLNARTARAHGEA
jgi:glutaconate CoA-transferase subunit B